ncbi:MAG: hypothetical protein Kow00105_08990 [Phycisphaeraceae bacterium]
MKNNTQSSTPIKINKTKRSELINDLIHAEFDLTVIQSKYGLTPDTLAQWVQDETNLRCLTGLCLLADLQTQILLSRYRLIAAGKLYELATSQPDDSKSAQDVARRACVDLLKLDLPRAGMTEKSSRKQGRSRKTDSLSRLQMLMRGVDSDKPADESPDDRGTRHDG